MPAGPLNYVNLSANGTFTTSGELQTHASDVDAIFDNLRATGARHLVLYFHGGLTSEAAGKQTADALLPVFQDRAKVYPVFFLWESGELEVLPTNLAQIGNDPLFRTVLEWVERLVIGKLKEAVGGRGLGGLELATPDEVRAERAKEEQDVGNVTEEQRARLTPLTNDEAQTFADSLEGDFAFQAAADAVLAQAKVAPAGRGLRGAPAAGAEPTLVSADVLESIRRQAGPDGRGVEALAFLVKPTVEIASRCIRRIITRTDHGIHCTAVEEIARQFYVDKIGAFVWSAMKQRTSQAFLSNDGLADDHLHGGTYFLEKLRDFLADPAAPPLQVSLMGHSAGAIYVCNLLNKAYTVLDPGFTFHTIALLAPAVDFGLFKQAIVDHQDRFQRFRGYGLHDEVECRDAMVPVLYPRSLLYCVSGLLEGDDELPLVGMERFYSGEAPYDDETVLAGRAFVKMNGASREVWSIEANAGAGLNCAAEHHGGFPLEAVTQTSLVELLGE